MSMIDLMSHQTHDRSYRGWVFTGQMTQPTVSEHWRKDDDDDDANNSNQPTISDTL